MKNHPVKIFVEENEGTESLIDQDHTFLVEDKFDTPEGQVCLTLEDLVIGILDWKKTMEVLEVVQTIS